MEELNKIFSELQEIPILKNKLLDLQKQEKELIKQLKDLKRDKNSYEELLKEINLDDKIKELEYLNVQLSNLKIEASEIQTIDDFIFFCNTYMEKNIFLEKIQKFLNYKLKFLKNCEFYIFNEIEDCLDGKVNSDCLKEILVARIKELLVDFNFQNLYFLELEDEIGIFIDSKVESGVLKQIEEKFNILCKIIAGVLKDIFVDKITDCNFDYKTLKQFNSKFENTLFFIKNLEESILDILVKEILRKCKIIPNLETFNKKSELATKINKIYQKILENTSKRQNKALEIAIKAITKYFELSDKIETLYIYFLDSLFLQLELSNSDLLIDQIYEIKEKSFTSIIEKESINDYTGDLNENQIRIKKKIGEFEERLEFFVPEKEKLFKICFYEKSFTNFFRHIIDFNNLTKEESQLEALKCEYLISQCFISPTEINNYRKTILLKEILKNKCMFKDDEVKEILGINYLYKLMQTIPWCTDLEAFLEGD